MDKPNLADEFRKAGIGIGDLVEMANFTDSIDAAIGQAIGEVTPLMNGWLVQVTALGEQKILGFSLQGDGTGHENDFSYGGNKWIRCYDHEQEFGGRKVFRKVGQVTPNGYEFTYPMLENIYTRCQRKTQ